MQFKGITNHPDRAFSKVTVSDAFQETLQQWREQLENLSADFCAGEASIDPIDQQACLFCDLQPLCRVHES